MAFNLTEDVSDKPNSLIEIRDCFHEEMEAVWYSVSHEGYYETWPEYEKEKINQLIQNALSAAYVHGIEEGMKIEEERSFR